VPNRPVGPDIGYCGETVKGDGIRLTARVLQLVDIYDVLTTSQAYREALSPKEAFARVHEEVERGWRDCRMVEQFEATAPGAGAVTVRNS